VLLERPEDLAHRHLHLERRLHLREDDQATVLEQRIEPGADAFVGDVVVVDPGDARAERQLVRNWLDIDIGH